MPLLSLFTSLLNPICLLAVWLFTFTTRVECFVSLTTTTKYGHHSLPYWNNESGACPRVLLSRYRWGRGTEVIDQGMLSLTLPLPLGLFFDVTAWSRILFEYNLGFIMAYLSGCYVHPKVLEMPSVLCYVSGKAILINAALADYSDVAGLYIYIYISCLALLHLPRSLRHIRIRCISRWSTRDPTCMISPVWWRTCFVYFDSWSPSTGSGFWLESLLMLKGY